MDNMPKFSNGGGSSGGQEVSGAVPKPEPLASLLPGSTVASSSGSNVRSVLLGMGFLPTLVDKAINEKGEENMDMLLETLFEYSASQKPNSISSDSLGSLFDDDNGSCAPEVSSKIQTEELTNEALNGPMEKKVRLLEMGFSENQVSAAIERFGSEVPLSELADSIFADQIAADYTEKDKLYPSTSSVKNEFKGVDGRSSGEGICVGQRCHSNTSAAVKMEDGSPYALYQSGNINRDESFRGKRPKQEYCDDYLGAGSQVGQFTFEEMGARKKPKQEYFDGSRPFSGFICAEESLDSKVNSDRLPRQPNSSRSLDQIVAKRPYFFYGNVANISEDSWTKISQFLYAAKPEFVYTRYFSALSRKEGYIHNLPTENRFYICPKPPMSIEDAIPTTKKWWPSWDTRKQFNSINSEITGISELCNRLGRILYDSRGLLSPEQQRDILHHCQTKNLVWVGKYKLSAAEPEHLECILGYPPKHTEAAESSLVERLQFLKYCFQTDTLGYHLSVLKSLFPNGVTVLSVFSGIGGTEIALHRLGIQLRGVVSIEISEMKRKILRRWWNNTGQFGDLVQIEDVQKLTTAKLESLMDKFGGFDLVTCQNPSGQSPTSKIGPDSDDVVCFDFSLFYEFVRIFQRVRNYMERRQ